MLSVRLCTYNVQLLITEIQSVKQRFKKFDDLLKTLPIENRETLKMLLRHLHRFSFLILIILCHYRVAAHSDKNRMQAHNLAIMFGPTLFHNGEEKPKKNMGKKSKKDNKKVNTFCQYIPFRLG